MNIKRFNGNDFPGDKWVRDILSRVNEIIDYLKLKVTRDRLAPALIEEIDEVTEAVAPLTSVGTDGQVLTSDGTTAGWESLPIATATVQGVVKGGEIPGQTSGAAIASGYIGEIKTAAVNSVANIGDGSFNTTNQLTLPAGVWLIAYYDGVYRQTFSGTSGLYQQINAAILNETDVTTVAQSGYFQYTHINNGTDREMQYAGHFHVSYPVNISTQKTFRGIVGGSGGAGRFATRGMGSFYAVRIA